MCKELSPLSGNCLVGLFSANQGCSLDVSDMKLVGQGFVVV